MNADIEYTLRNYSRAAAVRGVDTLAYMREDYRACIEMMVDRGYGDAATLNSAAAEWATKCLGPRPPAGLERAAWYTLGQGLVLAQAEYDDPHLDLD